MKMIKKIDRLRSLPLVLLALTLLAGCATPQPKEVDIRTIPVYPKEDLRSEGSLWPGETSKNTFFQDMRAKHVGDLITIIVSEQTAATKTATTTSGKDSTMSAGITNLFGAPLGLGTKYPGGSSFSPEVDSIYASHFSGAGTTKRSGTFSATITARVMEVLPNGNLFIQGKKDTKLNKEEQYLVVSGIVRPNDISDLNTVLSASISDAKIEYSGKGVVADVQNAGFLRRILDHAWPF